MSTPEVEKFDPEAALKLYRTFSDKEIRRRQSLCAQQIKLAHEQRNAEALVNLRLMDNTLMQAMLERTEEPLTDVVFRKWKAKKDGSGVIALFPGIPHHGYMVSSFEHDGQHGAADYDGVIGRTRAAAPEEYAALKHELESRPYEYKLRVRKRRPH